MPVNSDSASFLRLGYIGCTVARDQCRRASVVDKEALIKFPVGKANSVTVGSKKPSPNPITPHFPYWEPQAALARAPFAGSER